MGNGPGGRRACTLTQTLPPARPRGCAAGSLAEQAFCPCAGIIHPTAASTDPQLAGPHAQQEFRTQSGPLAGSLKAGFLPARPAS